MVVGSRSDVGVWIVEVGRWISVVVSLFVF